MTTTNRRRYVRRPDRPVVAVRLSFDMDGLIYRKWGGEQLAKRGDWVVDNDGDIYTVDADVFARTYRQTGVGTYVKTTPVWAEVATTSGRVQTKEGITEYHPGDYLVFNEESGADGYAMTAGQFEKIYEPAT